MQTKGNIPTVHRVWNGKKFEEKDAAEIRKLKESGAIKYLHSSIEECVGFVEKWLYWQYISVISG